MSLLNTEFQLIQSFLDSNDYEHAYLLLDNLIYKLERSNDDNLACVFYEYAFILFETKMYEKSLIMFDNAYKLSYKKKEILEFIFDCFINPNLESFKKNYNKNISEYSKTKLSNPLYQELSLEFIPISDTKYYIYDYETDSFDGIIDFENKFEEDNISFDFKDKFSDILIIDDYNLSNINRFNNINDNKVLYYISRYPLKMLSFFKLENISNIFLKNVTIFESTDMLFNFFRNNPSVYLPKITLSGNNLVDKSFKQNIRQLISSEHEFRLTKAGRDDSNILLSICIPTWNRGHRALENITSLLNLPYDNEIEFIVADNGSTLYVEEYENIKQISDSRINYSKSQKNEGFINNFMRSMDFLAKGKFALIISDEDLIDANNLSMYLSILKTNNNIAVLRPGTASTYTGQQNVHLSSGETTIPVVFLANNYISGIIYNVNIFRDRNLSKFILNNSNNVSCHFYAHLWLDSIMVLYGDLVSNSLPLCIEGESELKYEVSNNNRIDETDSIYDIVPVNEKLPNLPLAYSAYQNRIDQHNGFIELINQLPIQNLSTCIDLYSILCEKTNTLVGLVIDAYEESGCDCNKIYDELYDCFISGIDKLNLLKKQTNINLVSESKKELIQSINTLLNL